jgi:hypothetical protein
MCIDMMLGNYEDAPEANFRGEQRLIFPLDRDYTFGASQPGTLGNVGCPELFTGSAWAALGGPRRTALDHERDGGGFGLRRLRSSYCLTALAAPRSYQPALVSILEDNQCKQGYQQEDAKPPRAREKGPEENQRQHQPSQSNPVRNVCHRYKSPLVQGRSMLTQLPT